MPGPIIAPPLTDTSPDGLRAAIEADSIGTRVLGGELPHEAHVERDAAWAVGEANDPWVNVVASARFDPSDADERIERIVAAYDALPSPFLWWRAPFHGPTDLAERLERAHVYPVGDSPAMAMDLALLGPRPDTAAGFAVRGVVDESGLLDYIAVLSSDPPPPGAPPMHTPEKTERRLRYVVPSLAREPLPLRLVGYADGRPVASARLSLAGGAAGIYSIQTVAGFRGRGYGAAITHDALARGRELGYRVATLQSSDMGYGIYRRLGFEDVFTYQLHVHLPGGARYEG
ncbi:MAG TPA: GNAT family N-acetyltransferase [Candidatus Limnocylindrales bacterium]